jgi:hypothetical protein
MMYQWGVKFLTIFNGYQTRDVIASKFPKTMKKELIIEALKSISKFVVELQTQEVQYCLFRITPQKSRKHFCEIA